MPISQLLTSASCCRDFSVVIIIHDFLLRQIVFVLFLNLFTVHALT